MNCSRVRRRDALRKSEVMSNSPEIQGRFEVSSFAVKFEFVRPIQDRPDRGLAQCKLLSSAVIIPLQLSNAIREGLNVYWAQMFTVGAPVIMRRDA